MTLPTTLPPCMMPDGGECCPEYHALVKENMQLRNLLEAVREDNQRLRVQASEKRTHISDAVKILKDASWRLVPPDGFDPRRPDQ